MKRILSTSLLLACTAVIVCSAQAAKPDFSGTWKFDPAKSDFGQVPAPDVLTLVVVHKDPAMKITSTQTANGATTVNERNVTTDGKPNVNTLKTPDGNQSVTSTSKWTGATLQTSYTLQMQGASIPTVDTWELTSAKVLIVTRKLAIPDGSEIVVKVSLQQTVAATRA